RTPRSRSQVPMSIRCGVASRRCDLATIPSRVTLTAKAIDGIQPQKGVRYKRRDGIRQFHGSCGPQVEKKLLIAGGAGDDRWRHRDALEPGARVRLGHARDYRVVD